MGKGGQRKVSVAPKLDETSSAAWKSPYVPTESQVQLPTKGQVKAVIPKHCFERSYLKGIYYVLRDTAWAVGLAFLTSKVLSTEVPSDPKDLALWTIGWASYAFGMGTIWFGHWILAHECGHGAFSPSQTFNDVFGFVMHQFLLVPYFAWQYSHAKHHRRVNHTTDGESHVPSTKTDVGLSETNEKLSGFALLHDILGDCGFAATKLGFYLLVGYPLYLLGMGSSGRLAHDGSELKDRVPDHYRPGSPLFPHKVQFKIALSSAAQIAFVGSLLYAGQVHYGHLAVFLWYWAPYLWVNAWLVIYTWLHHTDASVPHYGDDEWTWMKGTLATIDRPYGIFDFFHHRIGSTHVVHHLFHELPWYHA